MASSRRLPLAYNTSTYGDVTRDYQVGELTVWEAATDIDLVTATAGEILDCYDDAASFDDYVAIAGATTNSSYFRVIRPAGVKGQASWQGHDGTPNNGVTFICATDVNIFGLQENYSQVQDVIAKVSVASGISIRYAFAQTSLCNLSAFVGCIAYDCLIGDTGIGQGFAMAGAASNIGFAVDCLAHNCEGDGFRTSSFVVGGGGYLYNCTSTNNGTYGFRMLGNQASGIHIRTNCLASSNTTADFSDGTTNAPTRTVTYCASGDDTADDLGGAGNRISTDGTLVYVNSGGDDFHLAPNDTRTKDWGTDLSADGTYAFDDDIDWSKRPCGSAWDISFDECPSLSVALKAFVEGSLRGSSGSGSFLPDEMNIKRRKKKSEG